MSGMNPKRRSIELLSVSTESRLRAIAPRQDRLGARPPARDVVLLAAIYIDTGGNLNPSRATCNGRTRAPASPIAVATRLAAPFSTRKITHPPPPAPHTLAALPPCLPATVISLSMKGVVIPGALLRRIFHSSRNNRPTPSQSLATHA